jgi:hypothetical protein
VVVDRRELKDVVVRMLKFAGAGVSREATPPAAEPPPAA